MKNIKFHHIVYVALLLFLGNSLINSMRLFFKAQNNLHEAQLLLEAESEHNNELHNKLALVGKQIYIERVARDTLGLAHENEVVFVLPPEEEVKKLSPRLALANSQLKKEPQIPHWQEWVKLFL